MAIKPAKNAFKTTKKRLNAEKKVNVTFRLQKELLNQFKAQCEADDIPMSATIEELMRIALNIRSK